MTTETKSSAVGVRRAAASLAALTLLASCTETVVGPQKVCVMTVTASTASITLERGASQVLTATADAGADCRSVQRAWRSDNPTVAAVSREGRITGVSTGTATVRVVDRDETGVEASSPVAVTVVAPVTVGISVASTELMVGQTRQLTATVGGTTNQSVTWTSNATQVVSVSATGLATAAGVGTATITATSVASPTKSASVILTVSPPAARVVHRWSFSESGGAGTVLVDAVGGKNGRIVEGGPNNALVGSGQVRLTGGAKDQSDYVELPSGLVSALGDATIELWTTVHGVQAWARLFDFGRDEGNFLMMSYSRSRDAGTDRVEWRGGFGVADSTMAPYPLDRQVHVVMTIDEGGGAGGATQVRWYLDGALRGSAETTAKLSSLNDVNNWLGRSQFPDETANASWNEFRIWNGALSAAEVQASFVRGPDALPTG